MIKYKTSTGELVSEATIKARLSKSYREKYFYTPNPICEGCEQVRAQGSGHYIPKARLKVLGLADYIYNPKMYCPACNICNTKMENPSSKDITELKNYNTIVEITERYDPERATKFKL